MKRPETLALLVALLGSGVVLAAFVVNLGFSRGRELETSRQRLQHAAAVIADHSARSLNAVDMLLKDLAQDLADSRSDWQGWDANRAWSFLSQHHLQSLPQLREVALFDENGQQRLVSGVFPAPALNERERPFFRALAGGSTTVTFGPFMARTSGRYTYGLARRLTDGRGGFAGAVAAHIEPAFFPEFCWANRLAEDFEAVLINAGRQVVASCRPADSAEPASILGADAATLLAGGALHEAWPESSSGSVAGFELVSVAVPNYSDLRVVALLPRSTILAPWTRRAWEFGLFAGLVVAVLLAGGWLVRRQVRELSQLTAALDENRRHLEERIQEATAELAFKKEEAERASTAKSRFLAAASHDLRQPLHALSLFAADLQRQVRSGSTSGLERVSDQIATSTSVLGELLDSLLDVSRLDVAGIKTEITPFAVQSVFDRLAASYRRPAQAKRLALKFRPCRRFVLSDMTLVERLLANLISNAIRYTPEGGRVLVAARFQGDTLRIEVRDNGIGIAPEHQAAIFAEFYQVGNLAREQNKGLGLGLSIVDRLAHALEAPIYLRSEPGAGTTFGVALPLCAPGLAPEQPESPPERRPRLFVFGQSESLDSALRLATTWGWEPVQGDPLSGQDDLFLDPAVVIADRAAATLFADRFPDFRRLIAVTDGHEPAPVGSYVLAAPIRPAKLRALLEQLQKTESKSMA